jgi:hypothetical protein
VRHGLALVLAFSAAVTVLLAAGASAAGPGGWSHLGTGGKAGTAPLNDAVYALNSQNPGVLYAGGAFTSAGGNPGAAFIARWNGTTWAPVGSPALDGAVNAIAYSAGRVFVGGQFTNAGGNPNADFVAVWDGVSWKPFCSSTSGGPAFGGSVQALQIIGSTLYVGGSFGNGGGIASADYLLACDLSTGASHSLVSRDGDITGGVYALTADSNGTLYAAGQFINMAGIPAADHVAAYSGGAWHALGTGPSPGGGSVDDYVRSITALGTNVYIGSDASNIGGIAQADHVARWNGSTWSAMGSATGGANGWFSTSTFIYGLAAYGSRVYATGSFQNSNGDPRSDFIAVFDGSAWHNVGTNGAGNGPLGGIGQAVAVYGQNVVAGGHLNNAGGDPLADFIASYPLAPDTTPPKVTAYSLHPAAFTAAQGTTVRYRVSEPAKVTFSVQRGGRTVRRATRTSPAGANRFRLLGKGLAPGSYGLVAMAVDAAGNRSSRVARPFRITP